MNDNECLVKIVGWVVLLILFFTLILCVRSMSIYDAALRAGYEQTTFPGSAVWFWQKAEE